MSKTVLMTAAAAALLISAGWVHGVWTDRFATGEDLDRAARRLEDLPWKIGAWEGKPFEDREAAETGLAGSVARLYVHRETGRRVSLYLACGRPGPVSVHTPEVCYAASGFEVERPSRFTVPAEAGGGEFWTSRLVRRRQDDQSNLRIYWSWHAGSSWQVAENPRLTFAGRRLLHKLYLVRETVGGTETPDPCVEFMKDLLPVLGKDVLAGPGD